MNAPSPASHMLFLRLFGANFRKTLHSTLLLTLILLASQAASATIYTVTNTLDSGVGSLRDAMTQVNAGAGGDVINFSGVTGTITLTSVLSLSKSVTINGPGANLLTVSGNDAVQVFNAAAGTAVTISGLTIAHGFGVPGAGILAAGTALTVNSCTFSNNRGNGGNVLSVGGAINGGSTTAVTVNSSTFLNNSATASANPNPSGGAIWSNGGTLVVNNSTFIGNSAQSGGAIGLLFGNRLTVHNSTIVGNSAVAAGTGGISIGGFVPVVTNSIISGNTGGDCSKCTTPTVNNLIGGTAVLGPLQYNGGPTETMLPLASGTGIIGAGLNSTLATDQRGIPRPTAGASDLGAVQTYNLTITTTDDSSNSGTTCSGTDTCSLRDAIGLADSHGAGDVLTATGLQGTITLATPLPDVNTDLNIVGPGANQLTISGANTSGIFNITNSNAVTNFSGLTITNGNNSTGGGGINNAGSSLTLSNCAFTGNTATGASSGGGLANTNPAGSSTVTNCTFSANTALNGGGIYNLGALLVTNSTFSGNNAPGTAGNGSGGGIFNQGAAVVTSSTVSGNTASSGGGIFNNASGAITVINSLVAGNTEVVSPNDDCSSCGTQNPFNLISTAGAPIAAAQVMLAPLAYNGLTQAVQTLLPLPGSPAIETGDPTQLPTDLATDERQLPRTLNSKLDLGAVETNYTAIQFVQQPSNTTVNTSISPAVTMSVTESGTTAVNVPLPITFTGAGALHGTVIASTHAPAIPGDPALASFGGQSGDTVGAGDTLASSVTVTPVGITPAQTLIATSNPFDITQATADMPAVTVGPTSPTYGQPETVTVTVPATGSVPPTGVVTIYDNGNPIGTGTLGPNGTVTITIPGGTLPAGSASITVGYLGDGNYGSSTSVPVPVTVSTVTSVPTVTVGPTSPTAGQPATVTVTVPTVGNTPPTGTVTIYDNGNSIGTGTLGLHGTVTVNIPGGLPEGNNTITAGYPGAGNYGSATSAPVSVTVASATTGTATSVPTTSVPTVTVGPSSPFAGQPATVTVTVPTVGSAPPTGTVTIYDNGNPIGTGTLGPNGTVTVNIPGGLPAGSNSITVGYSGGGAYGASSSVPVSVTVATAPVLDFMLTLTSAPSETVISGSAAPLTLQVAPTSGSYPGLVTFTATGLPPGATATFAPATVTVSAGPAPISLSIQTASVVATNGFEKSAASIALGLLLLPLAGARRLRRNGYKAGRHLFLMLVLLAGVVAAAGLTGCGTNNGFFGHAPQTYNITITAISETVQHSVNATLNVQ